MSSQYICELYFDRDESNWKALLRAALKVLGFSPNIMSVYATFDEMYEDVSYNEDFLLSIAFEKNIPGITIRNHLYDEDAENPWFKFGHLEGKFASLKWSNTNLDFLLSEKIEQFLKMDGFTAGYAFDNKDIWEQSRKAKEKGKLLDYNVYPGQYKYVCGMQFMAAPSMWFGKPFFEIISKNKLLEFNKAHTSEKLIGIVEVNLFNIYESPENANNRINQKNFWSFFDLDKVISKFEEGNSIDAVQSLKDFLAKNRPKKTL